jgi:hypothetical protein
VLTARSDEDAAWWDRGVDPASERDVFSLASWACSRANFKSSGIVHLDSFVTLL